MLIYNYKYLKPSYSIKSQNVIKTAILAEKNCLLKDNILVVIMKDLKFILRPDLFPIRDRQIRTNFIYVKGKLLLEPKLIYEIDTIERPSFISNHETFYDVSRNIQYLKKGNNKKIFGRPKADVSTETVPVYSKEYIIKLGSVGSYMDYHYKQSRRIRRFKEV